MIENFRASSVPVSEYGAPLVEAGEGTGIVPGSGVQVLPFGPDDVLGPVRMPQHDDVRTALAEYVKGVRA
jgi:hypothetical protein